MNKKNYKKVTNAKIIVAGILDKNENVEDALEKISACAWSIRHQDYALFRAIMAVYHAAYIREDLRWGLEFNMPATADALDWMKRFSRKYARQDERYIKERGI